jgi:hypothetical protein
VRLIDERRAKMSDFGTGSVRLTVSVTVMVRVTVVDPSAFCSRLMAYSTANRCLHLSPVS